MLPTHSVSPQRAVENLPVIPASIENEKLKTFSFIPNSEKPSHMPKVFEMINACIRSFSFLTNVAVKSELEFIVHGL